MTNSVSDYFVNSINRSTVELLLILEKLQALKGKKGRILTVPTSFDDNECFHSELVAMQDSGNFDNATAAHMKMWAENVMILRYIALDVGISNAVTSCMHRLESIKYLHIGLHSYYSDQSENEIHVDLIPSNYAIPKYHFERPRYSRVDSPDDEAPSEGDINYSSARQKALILKNPGPTPHRVLDDDSIEYTIDLNGLKIKNPRMSELPSEMRAIKPVWMQDRFEVLTGAHSVETITSFPYGFRGDTNFLLIPLFTPFIMNDESEMDTVPFSDAHCITIHFANDGRPDANGEISATVEFLNSGDASVKPTGWDDDDDLTDAIMHLIRTFENRPHNDLD